ncbi:hypothetical protein OC846_005036 [Tilletia horrida]|uniref:MARVEL domain-containing protein n=1 Tax=Tilletia horrida TaxID=155126 RepID=A0AAN6GLK1_9BASI|nr:hypothetical protein OC846_005036 [Tilletia horrida]KAK0564874.1 hypothetical protein OC861_004051 [Tilletia horrida]
MTQHLMNPWGIGRALLLSALLTIGVATGAIATKSALFWGTFADLIASIPFVNAYYNLSTYQPVINANALVAFDGFFTFLVALINITLSLVTERPRLAGPLTVGFQAFILFPLWLAGAILVQKRNPPLNCANAAKFNFSKSDCQSANATAPLAWTCFALTAALLAYSVAFLFFLPKSRGGLKHEQGSGPSGSNEFSTPFMVERRSENESLPTPANARS